MSDVRLPGVEHIDLSGADIKADYRKLIGAELPDQGESDITQTNNSYNGFFFIFYWAYPFAGTTAITSLRINNR